jgi:hypothetical protein
LENSAWPSGVKPRKAYSRTKIVQASVIPAWPIAYLNDTKKVGQELAVVLKKQGSGTF